MTITRIKQRRGTAAAWTAANPTLDSAEFGVETDTGKIKLGDGSTAWTALNYLLEDAALTGTPTAPTAAPGTDTTQIATTAFVGTAVDNATFRVVGSGTTPEANAAAARPTGAAPVYWMMAGGVTPTNAVAGDIIWDAATGTITGKKEFHPLDIDWDTLFWADSITGLTDGDPVATWADASGNAHDATQATSAKRPIYRAALAGFNNKAVVEFDGVDDWLVTAAFTSVANGEVALIVQRTGASTDQRAFFNGIAAGNRWSVGSRSTGVNNRFIFQGAGTGALIGGTEDNAKHYLRADFGATDRLLVDGTQVVSGDAGSESLTGIRLGADVVGTAQFLPGYIALLGFKASPLTPTEQANMLAWSRSYYGTP